jgi:hypothetical protein
MDLNSNSIRNKNNIIIFWNYIIINNTGNRLYLDIEAINTNFKKQNRSLKLIRNI